jgi:hypothetical protein
MQVGPGQTNPGRTTHQVRFNPGCSSTLYTSGEKVPGHLPVVSDSLVDEEEPLCRVGLIH